MKTGPVPKGKQKCVWAVSHVPLRPDLQGAGAFLTESFPSLPDVGGNLPQILGYEETEQLLKESDQNLFEIWSGHKSVWIE